MGNDEKVMYEGMTVQERAEFLLSKGVEAEIDIDRDELEPGYVPWVKGVGRLPLGFFFSEQDAIQAGTAFLEDKARGSGHD